MSQRRQQRRAKQVRRTNTRASQRAKQPPTPADIAARVVRDYRELLESRDPLDSEVVASHLMAPGWEAIFDASDAEADQMPSPALAVVSLLRNLDPTSIGELGPATLALAHALVAADLEDPQLAAAGGVLIEQLRVAGVPDPVWAGELGHYEFVSCFDVRDPWMDQHQLLITFRDSADREHGIVALIDRTDGYQFAELDVIEKPAEMLAEVRGQVDTNEAFQGMVIDELSAGRAGYMLQGGIEGTFDARGEALREIEDGHGGLDLLQLVLSRQELLAPAADADMDEAAGTPFDSELDAFSRDQLLDRFNASSELADEPDATPGAVEQLITWAHDFAHPRALFGPTQVEDLLIDHLPPTVVDVDERAAIADPMLAASRAWARHTASLAGLDDVVLDDALGAIEHYDPHFRQAMAADPGSLLGSGNVGSMHQLMEIFMQRMIDEGVDTDDMDAVREWLEANRPSLEG